MNFSIGHLAGAEPGARDRLVNAMMELLQEKDYADITVTDLTRRAGLSRMAYYRSFSSREEVLDRFMEVMGEQIHQSLEAAGLRENARAYFEALFEALGLYASLIRAACKAHLGEMILFHIGRYMRISFPHEEEYRLHFIAGGFYHVLIRWIQNGCGETPAEMAEICSGALQPRVGN